MEPTREILGRIRAEARGVTEASMTLEDGRMVFDCSCGLYLQAHAVDADAFLPIVWEHAAHCPKFARRAAQYPLITAIDGFCMDCAGICEQGLPGGFPCRNVFVDEGGKRVGRCKCSHPRHVIVKHCDSSQRSR